MIMPIRVTFGYSSLDDFVSALNFAIINGADIISNSWSVLTSEPNYFPGEGFEIWTIDTPDSAGYNPNKETGEVLPSFGINYLSYTGRFGGISAACPQVSGTAALMLSINPNLSVYEIKNIIEKTAKK